MTQPDGLVTQRFIVEIELTKEAPGPVAVADVIHDAIASVEWPEWIYSIDGVDPE